MVLERAGIPFEAIKSDYEEIMDQNIPPETLAIELSKGKAQNVASKNPDAIVIGADTFIIFDGKYIGKPRDNAHAKEILTVFSGRTHDIVTGLTVTDGKKTISKSVHTYITFKLLTEAEIDAYIATGEPEGKAGAYAIQGIGSALIEKVEGSSDNVMGMPIEVLIEVLNTEFGCDF